MAVRTMRKMSAAGDSPVAQWDTETVSPERLLEIEKEFKDLTEKGWWAADITDKRDVLIKEFNPAADILLMPRVAGGR